MFIAKINDFLHSMCNTSSFLMNVFVIKMLCVFTNDFFQIPSNIVPLPWDQGGAEWNDSRSS